MKNQHYAIQTWHGRHLLVGGHLPNHLVKPGQTWASADGSSHAVVIDGIDNKWVQYTSITSNTCHEKDMQSFQTRYCLVLPTLDIPKELQ